MKLLRWVSTAICFLTISTFSNAQLSKPVTVTSLLREMTDRSSIARFPNPQFKLMQFSSYDRTQIDPSDPKTWFANQDYGQFIRTEVRNGKTEWVIMDQSGPGAIVRFWTPLLADKDNMIIRFYFDGEERPSIEANFNQLMRGKRFAPPPFGFVAWSDAKVTTGVAGDMYLPIPFAKGCKVTLSEVPFYYVINSRSYPTNTPVETFSLVGLDKAHAALDVASGLLETSSKGTIPRGDDPDDSVPLKTGESLRIALPAGPRAISDFGIDFIARLGVNELRSLIIQFEFDGERTVWCPIGDFFGVGTYVYPIWDRYRSGSDLRCAWIMPYRKSAVITLTNLGKRTISANLRYKTVPWKWDSTTMYFHATWRSQYPLATRPMSDWNYLTASGKGRYVGDTLTVMSPSPAWYGEGDQIVYIYGEKFPSQLGTGTEDYYGYSWGMANYWASPFMSMPLRDFTGRENWSGFTTTSRVRLLDSIPFEKSLKFDMEVWDWADCKLAYSVACFWYAFRGATSNRVPMPEQASRPLPELIFGIKNALEFENMPVIEKSDGTQIETQNAGLTQGTWSNFRQLFLQFSKVGGYADIQVPVAKPGKQTITIYGTNSYDYGIVRFSVNGAPAKEIDLFNETAIASGPIELGDWNLQDKEFILRVEVIGSNPRSKGAKYFTGLDCIVLRPLH